VLRGLSGLAGPPIDLPFLTYKFLVDTIYDLYETALGFDRVVKPWFDVWLPDSTVEEYVGEVRPTLTLQDVGPTGYALLFAQRRSKMTRRFFRLPEADGSDWVYLFDILTSSALPGPNAMFAERMLARNRRLFEKARTAGGTRYPIGALAFSQADWIQQYGDSWTDFASRKQLFDPDGVLTPGPGIF
jgi:FAD/FMN-containing dehydrogenase